MKRKNFLMVTILNVITAACFLLAGLLSDNHNAKYGFFIVGALFVITAVLNFINYKKKK